jgi:hypothetical protein
MKKIYLFIFALMASLSAGAQALPNMDLELWTNAGNYEQPNGLWATANPIVNLLPGVIPATTTKSSDAHGGSFSARMESKNWPIANILITGTLANGIFDAQSTNPATALKRGTPFTARPTSFRGWYKYSPVNGDSCAVYAWLTKWNGAARDTIGIALLANYSQAVSAWTAFDLPFVYRSAAAPDSISIVCASSFAGQSLAGQVGSTLWVDDLEIVFATGLVDVLSPEYRVVSYPVPASERVHFRLDRPAKAGTSIQVYSAMGALVAKAPVVGDAASVSVLGLSAGTYHYLITDSQTALASGTFQVQ